MITRKLSVFREPKYLELFDLFRSSDVGYTNLEMLMHNYEHSPGSAGGTFTASDPRNLEELKWAGINLVSTANNHAYDYGENGVLTNLENIQKAGLAYAGTGLNTSEARSPGYLDTPKGRIALISISSTFSEAGRALDQRPDVKGRPGLNAMRFHVTHTVDKNGFDELRRMNRSLGLEATDAASKNFRPPSKGNEDPATQLMFLGHKFVLGEECKISSEPNKRDLEDNLKWIRDARRMADWVLVSFHCHENGGTRDDPPEFLKAVARACIEEGADAFLGHGPHVTRGVEIYCGKPIFYSLGNFIFQNETVRWQPSFNYDLVGLNYNSTPADFFDARSANDTRGFPSESIYWESVVARCKYKNKMLTEVTLHPIDIGYGRSRAQRGRPLIADGDLSHKALNRMQRLSKDFGTSVVVSNNVGVISI